MFKKIRVKGRYQMVESIMKFLESMFAGLYELAPVYIHVESDRY